MSIRTQLSFLALAGFLNSSASFLPAADLQATFRLSDEAKWIQVKENVEVQITRSDLLISETRFQTLEGSWVSPENTVSYISAGSEAVSVEWNGLPDESFQKIAFTVGLQKELNQSDPASYSPNHPLNPNLNGLHWGWLGGYVFWAIEGRYRPIDSNTDKSTKDPDAFSFHFANNPNEVKVVLELDPVPSLKDQSKRTSQFSIEIDTAELLKSVTWNTGGMASHSREGDSVMAAIRSGIPYSFKVSSKGSSDKSEPEHLTSSEKTSNLAQVRIGKNVTPFAFTIPTGFPIPDLPKDNPLTKEGVSLGKKLFFDKRLSGNNTISCSSCHQPDAGFVDKEKAFSAGDSVQIGNRNSMALMNLAWKSNFFWDGRASSLREQVLGPIQNPVEMNADLKVVLQRLNASKDYPSDFNLAFGSEEITSDLLARALEQFVLTLISGNSRLDQALLGKIQLTDLEKRGFELFFTERDPARNLWGADCFHCHGGPLFTNHGFFNTGLDQEPADSGRMAVTARSEDHGKFVTPTLRNIGKTAPYMHDGRFKTLKEVLDFYSASIHRPTNLDPNLAKHRGGGLGLKEEDKTALIAFLETLNE